MITDLVRRMEDHSENFNKELGNIKKEWTRAVECDNWIKNTLEEIDRRLDDREEWNSDPEHKVVEIIQAEQKKDKKNLTRKV